MNEQKYTAYIEIYQLPDTGKWIVAFDPPHPASKFDEYKQLHEYDNYDDAKEKFDFYINTAKECGLDLKSDKQQSNGDVKTD